MLALLSVIVSVVVIAFLSILVLLSIEKLSRDTKRRVRHLSSQILLEYDQALSLKRNELLNLHESIEMKKKHEEDKKVVTEPSLNNPYQDKIEIVKEGELSSAEIYSILRNDYNFDALSTATKLLSYVKKVSSETEIIKSILNKIDENVFAQLDTLSEEDQFNVMQDALSNEELEYIKRQAERGIDLYNKLIRLKELKDYKIKFYVAD